LENNTHYIQEDTIDIRELFTVLKRRKKLIWSVTALFTLLALIYVLVATQWWQVNATLEIGKYTDKQTGKEVYLEDGKGVAQRLKVEYIDVYEHVKDRDSKIKSISASKKNPQFITVNALGKSNTLAITEIKKVINELQNKHQKIIDEIIAKKQSELDQTDRQIFQIENYKISDMNEKIKYMKQIKLPAIDKRISSIEKDLQNDTKQKEEATKNLSSLGNNASLAALRLAQIQGLEYKISENRIKLINMKSEKEKIIISVLPSLKRKREELQKINLASLQQKRNLIKLSMQPHNYYNTTVVGKIITQDKPAKPKKALITIVAFITGLMFSIFLAFFLEFLNGIKKKD